MLLDLLNVFAFAFWGPLFTAYAVTLGANPSLAGFLYGFYTFVHALSFLVFGKLSDRTSHRGMILIGYLVQAVTAFLFMAINRPIYLLIPLFISALSGGMIAPAWKALFTKVMQAGKEGKLWSFYDAGEAFVIAGGSVLAGLLAAMFGYKAIFVPLFLLNIIAVMLCFDPMLKANDQ